jgi:hypothetical protein
MKVAWSDVNNVQEAGHYPFRDGVIAILAMEIAIWRNRPDALFTLMRKNPLRDQVEYVLGKHEFPSGEAAWSIMRADWKAAAPPHRKRRLFLSMPLLISSMQAAMACSRLSALRLDQLLFRFKRPVAPATTIRSNARCAGIEKLGKGGDKLRRCKGLWQHNAVGHASGGPFTGPVAADVDHWKCRIDLPGVPGYFPSVDVPAPEIDVGDERPVFAFVFPEQDRRLFSRTCDCRLEAAVAECFFQEALDCLVVFNDQNEKQFFHDLTSLPRRYGVRTAQVPNGKNVPKYEPDAM